ncbi:phosphatase PAP2 family protein [Streptomyces sp. NPDC092296]|uniref:phosphatase PAP2 family protein n=1 Tax=Streptomyces sp. NPDC092296 TaxID=3366012 RepID=UPI00382C97D3
MRTQTNDAAPPGRPASRTAAQSQEQPRSHLTRRQQVVFAAALLSYLAVVVGVLANSWLVDLDWAAMLAKPYKRWPQPLPFLNIWIVVGQRGPSAIAACAWLIWRSHRTRSTRPLLMMGAALLLLNLTVGAVKIVTGRLGPHYAHYIGSPELFAGGQIFPSGHTTNSVVTWGVIAYLAVRMRRTGAVLAGVTAASIGLTTVYLGTHWVTDVVAAWAAGLLVLLALPLLEPAVAAADQRIKALWQRGRGGPPAPDWSPWDEAVQDELGGVPVPRDRAAGRPEQSPGRSGAPA